MKNIIAVLITLFILAGCKKNNSSSIEMSKKTEKLMQEMNASVGMPSITNYQEKRWAKMIFELRDKSDLVTYAYIVDMHGNLHFIGKCIGYGLPYSVQYTSPLKGQDIGGSSRFTYVAMPQADPNGLYMPDGLSATWLMMEDPETGEVKPVYIEQEIMVSPFRLKSVNNKGAK